MPSPFLAAIISKPQKPELAGILRDLIAWLGSRGYGYVLDHESASSSNRMKAGRLPWAAGRDRPRQALNAIFRPGRGHPSRPEMRSPIGDLAGTRGRPRLPATALILRFEQRALNVGEKNRPILGTESSAKHPK